MVMISTQKSPSGSEELGLPLLPIVFKKSCYPLAFHIWAFLSWRLSLFGLSLFRHSLFGLSLVGAFLIWAFLIGAFLIGAFNTRQVRLFEMLKGG